MLECREGGFPRSSEEITEPGLCVEARTQGQDIHEETNQAFQLGMLAPRDISAHQQVVAGAQAMQQHLECRQQGGVRRDAVAAGQAFECLAQYRRHAERLAGAFKRRYWRPWKISG